MKTCSCIIDKNEKAKQIRDLLRKDGDEIPEEDIQKITPKTLHQWVVECDCDNGEIIGAMKAEQTDWYLWTLKNAVVKKNLQGKGIGGTLMKKMVKKSIKQGAKALAADITYDNVKSKKMAKRMGFKPVSRFCWQKGKKPADIMHYVLYPPDANNKCKAP